MRFHPVGTSLEPEVVKAAWSDFIGNAPFELEHVRPHVLRAWQRSRAAGCSPQLLRANVLDARATQELLQRERRLIEVASPFLVALSRAAGDERHAAMLSDGDGRLLKIVGDEQTVNDEDFPHAGALLAEANAGANGIGTALADGHYVELVGPEHYIEGFHVFTCQGVPLAAPSGRHGGVISMSVRRVEAANKVRNILFCASEAAECELLASWLTDQLVEGRPLPALLESLRQDMIQRIAMTRLQIEVAARQIAAGGQAGDVVEAARALGRKFRRQARVWQDLVQEAEPRTERVRLLDLVEAFTDLMATELRVAGVTLRWGEVDDIAVSLQRQPLVRRLLDLFLTAIQHCAPEGQIELALRRRDERIVLRLATAAPAGRVHVWDMDLLALPALHAT